jgi:2-oxoglutarate dioxygenase / 2-oxoglutarate/L-arginine monooxygenase/decarboxylase
MTDLRTFGLPDCVEGTEPDIRLAHELIAGWRADGLVQISCDRWQRQWIEAAGDVARQFFAQPAYLKSRCVSDLTFAGYAAPGETFLICPDIPREDVRVGARWPGHGPVPWPSIEFRRTMRSFRHELGRIGDKLLHLAAIGLRLPDFETFTDLADDGWHHMLVQNLAPESTSDISTYGMLVITVHDGVITASPGELLEFLTSGDLVATPLQVVTGPSKAQVVTYFHEPAFDTGLRPVAGEATGYIHYGTHFTNVYMRRHPDRATTRRIAEEDRLAVLASLSERASVGA